MVALLVADAAAEPEALAVPEVAAAVGMLERVTPAAAQRPVTAGVSSGIFVS